MYFVTFCTSQFAVGIIMFYSCGNRPTRIITFFKTILRLTDP